jgi:thymidylate kinase
MIVILEGENKTGKTTLAKHIEKEYGFRYIKCSQPGKRGPYAEYREVIESILQKPENVVIDRFHIGEEVYGPIYRGRSGLSQENFSEIEQDLNKLNTILIYCYDNENNIAKRFKEENEEFANVEKIAKTLELYKVALRKSNIPMYRHKMKGKMDLIKSNDINRIIKKWLFIAK